MLALPPPPVFFVRVASKELTCDVFVRVANNGVKVACFDAVSGGLVRVADKGVTRAMAARNRDELVPRGLERTAWREDIVERQAEPGQSKVYYNITVIVVK